VAAAAKSRLEQLLKDKSSPIHIIGAGGVGMSGLALLLHNLGYRLTASDLNDSFYLQQLTEVGIETWVGSNAENIRPGSVVIHSSAVPAHDSEIVHAKAQNWLVSSRHLLLEFLTGNYFTIAVTGTHGKTTTSAWLAYVLEVAGFDPTALIGGKVLHWNSNIRLGRGKHNGRPILVIEADESDGSFHSIQSQVAILTNAGMDHVDNYKSEQEAKESFLQFFKSVTQNSGMIIASVESREFLQSLLDKAGSKLHDRVKVSGGLMIDGTPYQVGLNGVHNLMNASAVVVAALHLGIELEHIREGLKTFQGVGRRMQLLYDAHSPKFGAQLRIYDDYAHHPREMKAVVEALSTPNQQLYVVWEPHRISRFVYFHEDFTSVIKTHIGFENLIIMPPFTAGDDFDAYPEFQSLFEQTKGRAALALAEIQELDRLRQLQPQGKDIITFVFMGAGHSSSWAQQAVLKLRSN